MINRKKLMTQDNVFVTSTGFVTWIPAYKMTSMCKIDTTWFPFDEQQCELKFGSWTFNGFKLNIKLVGY